MEKIIRNEDVSKVSMGVPEGHKHLRTTVELADGETLVLMEATVANIARAYVTLKTHPEKREITLAGRKASNPKKGFAEWQLLEE